MGLRGDLEDYAKNNLDNKTIVSSNINAACNGEPCIVGLGESTRAACLGPIVVVAAIYPLSKWTTNPPPQFKLPKNPTRSERMFGFNYYRLNHRSISFVARIVSPNSISNTLGKRNVPSYQHIEIYSKAMLEAIRQATNSGISIERIHMGPGQANNYERLARSFRNTNIVLETHESQEESIARIAYLYARVIHERILKKWRFVESQRLGLQSYDMSSGSSATHLTCKFLDATFDEVFGYSTVCRFNVSTIRKKLEDKGAGCHWMVARSEQTMQSHDQSGTNRPGTSKERPGGALNEEQQGLFFRSANLCRVRVWD